MPNFNRLLGTPGKRVYALIVAAQVLYVVTHVWIGLWLIDPAAPLTGLLLTVTIAAALANLLAAVPVWVFTAVALVRGPRPMVQLPAAVGDEALPRIVVQIPGRNEPFHHVQRSIESVLQADYPGDKLSVQFIDNSDDGRWQQVAEHYAEEPRVRVEHRDGTQGFKGGNLNIGLSRLGEVGDPGHVLIGLLDVGDCFAPLALRPMATEFVHDERLGFVQGMFRTGNPDETVINWTESYVGDAVRRFFEGYIAHYGIPTLNGHCALIRFQALDEVGRWNDARVAEDWSTGISMLARGWNGKWVDYDPSNPDMVSTELVPSDIRAQQKQKRRWSTGATELLKLHLAEWMRSPMPWNQRLALFIRLGANFSVLPAFLVTLLFPLWLALALIGGGPTDVVYFGLISAIVQSPFLAANSAAALNYAREGRWKTAFMVVLAYPVDAFWRLPLFAHAGVGIVEGLTRGLKEFVITPKADTQVTLLGSIRSQGLVLGASLFSLLPLLVLLLSRFDRVEGLVLAVSLPPLLTIAALFVVPSTEWIKRRFRRAPNGPRPS